MANATELRAVRKANGAGAPLWQNVSSLILRRIRKGQYAVGHLLPREVDLADELRVSRNTVREAIRLLADEGLLLRRKRAGTLVVSTGSEGPLRFSVDQLQSFDRLIESSWIRVLKRERAPLPPGVLRSYPEAQPGKWLRVTTLRQGVPDRRNLFSSEIYLHPRLETFEPLVQHARGALFALIEKRTGERIARVDSVVRACVVKPAIARLLDVQPRSPALHISRRMLTRAGELLEVADTVLPESRYEIEMSFSR